MRLPAIVRHRLQSLLQRNRLEDELDDELRYHLDREAHHMILNTRKRGATPPYDAAV